MHKITPFLWLDDRIEEAVEFWLSVFPDAKVLESSRYGEGAPRPAGALMTVTFELAGQRFVALNGGPEYRFTPAISFFVRCRDQAEVDHYWEKLLAGGGRESQCGWLEDRFGLSWQIVPDALFECIGHPDPAKARRAMAAMLQMQKIDVAALRAAVAG